MKENQNKFRKKYPQSPLAAFSKSTGLKEQGAAALFMDQYKYAKMTNDTQCLEVHTGGYALTYPIPQESKLDVIPRGFKVKQLKSTQLAARKAELWNQGCGGPEQGFAPGAQSRGWITEPLLMCTAGSLDVVEAQSPDLSGSGGAGMEMHMALLGIPALRLRI